MARWDWYQGTVHGVGVDEVAASLVRCFDLSDLCPSRPRNGYHQGAEVRRGSRVLAKIWWGGNPGVHVIGTGEDSPAVAGVLHGLEHRVTRADACEDWVEAGLFDRLWSGLSAYAKAAGITINQQGDWVSNKGRTGYLGARTSSCQLVLYEKGAQMGVESPWVRLEVRVYPKGQAGYRVASWAPGEAFGAAAWLVEALKCIGWDHLATQGVGTVWRPSDAEKAKRHLVKQYKATISSWRDECGGSWESFGQAFEALAKELSDGVLLH